MAVNVYDAVPLVVIVPTRAPATLFSAIDIAVLLTPGGAGTKLMMIVKAWVNVRPPLSVTVTYTGREGGRGSMDTWWQKRESSVR
jgi:hypothetical protein